MVAERLREQFAALWKQLERFYTTAQEYAIARGYKKEDLGKVEIVTNSDWLEGLGLIEFLGKVGRHVRVGPMLARDSVKGRMSSAKGINFAEFTYQLLQSYDFWHLYQSKNCRIQVRCLGLHSDVSGLTPRARSAVMTSTAISRRVST